MPVWMILCLVAQSAEATDSARAAMELDRKGAELHRLGRYEEAARLQKRALRAWEEIAQTRLVDLAPPHANLAQTYLAQGKVSAAERETALASRLAGAESRARISLLFAKVHFVNGNYAEAELAMRAALPSLEGTARATAIHDLGMVRAAAGDLAGARELMERSMAHIGARSTVEFGRMLCNLGLVCLRQGDADTAGPLYRDGIAILEATIGKDHADVGMAVAEYSEVSRKLGRKSEAKVLERRARAILAASPAMMERNTIDFRMLR